MSRSVRPGSDAPDPPLPGVTYAGALRMEPFNASAMQALLGLLVALAGYALLVPVVAGIVLGAGWFVSGRRTGFEQYRAEAMAYEHLSGMLANNLAIGALVVLALAVVRYVHHRHQRWLASVQPGFRWRYALACLLACVVVLNAVFWVSRGTDAVTWHPEPGLAWWLVVILLTAPLQAAGEEFLFRGYLMQCAGAIGRNPWFAVGLSALVFASMHGTQNLPLFIDRLGFGLLAGALVVLTGGLEAAVAAHAVNNVFAFGYAAVSGELARTRAIEVSDWTTTGWNLLAYALTVLVCVWIGRRMRVARRTPGLASGGGIR